MHNLNSSQKIMRCCDVISGHLARHGQVLITLMISYHHADLQMYLKGGFGCPVAHIKMSFKKLSGV